MTDKIQSVAELYRLYQETQATAVTVLGTGDYGIEAEWVDGSRFIVLLGIEKVTDARDFASFLSAALPKPPRPNTAKGRQKSYEETMRDAVLRAQRGYIDDDLPIICPFKGYNVVAVIRTFAAVESLPTLDL